MMRELTRPGAMAAVEAPSEEVLDRMRELPELALAAVNSPDQCVISGALDSVAEA